MMGEAAEARRCEYESKRFKGTCEVDKNCADVCKLEGFPSGDCQGFRTGCFCTKPC
ncbi:Defensin-like protein [Linum perenne]